MFTLETIDAFPGGSITVGDSFVWEKLVLCFVKIRLLFRLTPIKAKLLCRAVTEGGASVRRNES